MLTEEMKERLLLLFDSDQITERTYDIVTNQLKILIENDVVDIKHDQIGSFTNHLAIAVERINQKEPLESTTSEIEEIIKVNPRLYKLSESALKNCVWEEDVLIPRAEAGFITLYLFMFSQKSTK